MQVDVAIAQESDRLQQEIDPFLLDQTGRAEDLRSRLAGRPVGRPDHLEVDAVVEAQDL